MLKVVATTECRATFEDSESGDFFGSAMDVKKEVIVSCLAVTIEPNKPPNISIFTSGPVVCSLMFRCY